MPTLNCPNADRLVAFQAGKLNHNELNAVASHVESCAACLTVLERVSTMKDTLVKELRHARSHDGYSDEADCQRAVAHAAALLGDATQTRDDTANGDAPADVTLTTLGKYQLLEKIGQGGMGTVYKAFHTLLKRIVALKVLPANRLKDTQAVGRFRREIEAAGRLDHPHIVRTSDADAADGQHFLVMEWLAGPDLARYVRERGPLPIEEACDFIRQAALGLACAHQHGMVHRDVKPSNLLVTHSADGTPVVKVLDLGLALLQADDSTGEELTSTDRVMGTYDYIAPEQALNSHDVDARADIYSLGCTFYFLLTARAPFHGQSETKKLLSHQREEPTPIAQFRKNAPREVVAVLNKMMAKNPAHRYASMSEVAKALADDKVKGCMGDKVTKSMSHPVKKYAAMLLLGGLLIAAAAYGVIRITTPDGDYVIETDDPNFSFAVSKGTVILDDKKMKRTYILKGVKNKGNGEWEVEVSDPSNDLVLNAQTFTIKRGEKVALKARFEPPQPADPERRVAEWLLRNGGVFDLYAGDRNLGSDWKLGALPAEPFQVGEMFFTAQAVVDDKVLDTFHALRGLQRLKLQAQPITDAGLARFLASPGAANLRTLSILQDNIADAGFEPLANLRSLLSISIRCPKITNATVVRLRGLPVTEIDVHSDFVTSEAFAALKGKKLTALSLNCPKVDDQGMEFIKETTTLLFLTTFAGEISDASLTHLASNTDLTNLSLDFSKVTGGGIHKIVRFRKLTGLSLRGLPLSDNEIEKLKALPELTALNLAETKVTDDGMIHVNGMKLAELTLNDLPITDKGLQAMKDARTLTSLYLGGTKVTDAGVKGLAAALPMCRIHWDGPVIEPSATIAQKSKTEILKGVGETAPPVGEIRRYLGHKDRIICLDFAPDGKSFVAGGFGELWLWDVDKSAERLRFPNTHGFIQSAVFSSDGERVIGPAQVGTVVVWDAKSGEGEKVRETQRFKIPSWVECVIALPDRPHVFYTTRGGGRIYDLDKKAELPTRFLGERASISKDGRRILTGDGATLYLWDVDTGKELSNVSHPGGITRVALAPDGRHAVAAVGKKVYQWDMDEKKQGKIMESPGYVMAVAISPDGKRLLTGGHDKKMRLWDLQTGAELHCFDGHTGAVSCVAFAPNGLQALSGSEDKTIRLWQLPTTAPIAKEEPKVKENPIQAKDKDAVVLDITTKLGIKSQVEIRDIGLSASSGSVLAELLYSRADTMQFRKSISGEIGLGRVCLDQGKGFYVFIPIRQITSIEADGKNHVVTLTDGAKQQGVLLTAVTGKDGKTQQLFDAKTVRVLTANPEKPAETKAPTTLLSQPGSSLQLSSYLFQSGKHGFGHRIRMIIGDGTLEPSLTDFDKVAVTPATDGKWRIAVTAPGGQETAGLLDMATAKGPRWYLIGETRNGWLVMLAYFNENPGFSLQKIKQANPMKADATPAQAEHSAGVAHLTVSRDGTKLLTYTSDKELCFWELDAVNATFKQGWKNKVQFVRGIALHPTGNPAWIANGGTHLSQVDTQTGDMTDRRKGRHDGATNLVFSADGRRYLAADFYGKISIRDTQEGEVLREFPGHAGGKFPGVRPAPQVCFSSDGERILTSGDDHTVRLWNSTNGEELKKLPNFAAAQKRFIALSPDGQQALVSQDNDVHVWDLNSVKSVAQLKGHKDHVTAVAYGPDGRWVVSASQDMTLRVWDVASGAELAKLEGHTDDVTCVVVTSAGRIYSGSRDKSVRAWSWQR